MNNGLAKIDNTESKRKYYLVDFNGVKSEGFDGIEKLSADDNVIVFFVKGESTVDFSLLSKLYSCNANVTMKEIETKDLILPVISMYIGRISNENPDIYLICKDGGNYIKTAEIVVPVEIKVQQNISGVVISPPSPSPAPTPENISVEKNKINPLLSEILKGFKISEITKDWIYEVISESAKQYPCDKYKQYVLVDSELFKKFGNNRIYSAIKPYI